MGTIANKINKVKNTKDKIKTITNLSTLNAITSETIFKDYPKQILKEYVKIINNGTDELYANFPKVEDEGTKLELDTEKGPLRITLKGNTSQDGTPTPETPVSIKVVTGEQNITIQSKNLCDLSQGYRRGYINANGGAFKAENVSYVLNQYIEVVGGDTYTYSTNQPINNMSVYSYNENKEFIKRERIVYSKNVCTVTVNSNAKYILLGGNYNSYNAITQAILNGLDIQLENGSTATPYTPYQSQTYPLSLGNIELTKIENYKDYIFKNEVDSLYYNANLDLNGWYYSNLFTKINSYNEETITTPYISTTGGLDIGATIYYYNNSNVPIKITDTTLISQLENINNNARSYSNTTIIECLSSTDDNEAIQVSTIALKNIN